MALPFGQTLFLWRRHRRLPQQQLAAAARLPRPNLSAIEQGRREVSLTTLRALAIALNVPAGVLVDGLSPGAGKPPRFLRAALERIAEAVAVGRLLHRPAERDVVDLLKSVVGLRARRGGKRHAEAAWLTLQARYPRTVVQTLLERIEGHRRLHVA